MTEEIKAILGRKPDLSGNTFGRWTVLKPTCRIGYKVYYICVCTCGNTKDVEQAQLTGGHSKSCGCIRTEMVVARSTTHGKYYTAEKKVHSSMLTRCYNTNYHQYHMYGGRGITVEESWKDFANFYKDMGPRPSPEHQLDRRDNSLGYSKQNCEWVTKSVNARNKRSTVLVEYEGKMIPLIEVAETLNIDYHALFYRYQKGERGALLFRPSSKAPLRNPINTKEPI